MRAWRDPGGANKDTTHIAIIDRAGNIFDSTPSRGWIGGAVVLGDTGIPMSVRGEQFWLNSQMAAQLRPRERPRYKLHHVDAGRAAGVRWPSSRGGGPVDE